jgi:hypothetical protein
LMLNKHIMEALAWPGQGRTRAAVLLGQSLQLLPLWAHSPAFQRPYGAAQQLFHLEPLPRPSFSLSILFHACSTHLAGAASLSCSPSLSLSHMHTVMHTHPHNFTHSHPPTQSHTHTHTRHTLKHGHHLPTHPPPHTHLALPAGPQSVHPSSSRGQGLHVVHCPAQRGPPCSQNTYERVDLRHLPVFCE